MVITGGQGALNGCAADRSHALRNEPPDCQAEDKAVPGAAVQEDTGAAPDADAEKVRADAAGFGAAKAAAEAAQARRAREETARGAGKEPREAGKNDRRAAAGERRNGMNTRFGETEETTGK